MRRRSRSRQAKDERDTAEKQRRRAEENEGTARHSLYIANMHRIRFELENNNVSAARELLALHRPGTGEKVWPGWEWYYWDRVCRAELQTLKGHTSAIRALAYSPDGSLLASAGGGDPVVNVWDAATGKKLRALQGHESPVSQVAFSPDGKILASYSFYFRFSRAMVKLWDVATWTEVPGWKPEPEIRFLSVAFSPDGKALALAESKSKSVKVWDLVGMKWADPLPEGTASSLIRYSPDGRLIAVVLLDGLCGLEHRALP